MSDPLLTGRNENTPWRAMNRVIVVIVVAALIVGALIYGLFAAFGGKQHGSTAPAAVYRVSS